MEGQTSLVVAPTVLLQEPPHPVQTLAPGDTLMGESPPLTLPHLEWLLLYLPSLPLTPTIGRVHRPQGLSCPNPLFTEDRDEAPRYWVTCCGHGQEPGASAADGGSVPHRAWL